MFAVKQSCNQVLLSSMPKQPQTERVVALNARVPESFRKELRVYALQHDLTITELIIKAFDALKKSERGGR